jgi:hypothetical protein
LIGADGLKSVICQQIVGDVSAIIRAMRLGVLRSRLSACLTTSWSRS